MKKGFSLIEILAVIAIVGILTSVLVPAISGAYAHSKTAVCKNMQRQLVVAGAAYQNDHNAFPPSVVSMFEHWDSETVLWQYVGNTKETMVCPEHYDNQFSTTGFNYNTSFLGDEYIIGSGALLKGVVPSSCSHPAQCAMFGDGFDNKFMRSTLSNLSTRCGGRQAFRHNHFTVVGWLDGHVTAQDKKFNNNCDDVPDVGFLSNDDSAYDPRTLTLN